MGKTFVEDERPCDLCVNVTRYGCVSWNCEYINRDEAIKAWREKREMADRKTEPQIVGKHADVIIIDKPQTDYLVKSSRKSQDGHEITQAEMPRCSINGTPFDECGFCEYFNCDTCRCEADRKE